MAFNQGSTITRVRPMTSRTHLSAWCDRGIMRSPPAIATTRSKNSRCQLHLHYALSRNRLGSPFGPIFLKLFQIVGHERLLQMLPKSTPNRLYTAPKALCRSMCILARGRGAVECELIRGRRVAQPSARFARREGVFVSVVESS